MLVRLVVEDTALVYATGPADELECHTAKTADQQHCGPTACLGLCIIYMEIDIGGGVS